MTVAVALLLQTLAAQPDSARLADSVRLIGDVRERHSQFVLLWRCLAGGGCDGGGTSGGRPAPPPPTRPAGNTLTVGDRFPERLPPPPPVMSPSMLAGGAPGVVGDPADLRRPEGIACNPEINVHRDMPQNVWAAHLIKAPILYNSWCAKLSRTTRPPDTPGMLDTPLRPDQQVAVVKNRANFLKFLDSAQRVLPGDNWLIGQRVRFRLDQYQIAEARRVADTCGGARWWCLSLRGFVDYLAGSPGLADSSFRRAHPAMPLAVRCEWDDLEGLLPYNGGQAYSELPCGRRDTLNVIAWWLADPLFVDNGNERYLEQMVRRVQVELRNDTEYDYATDLRPQYLGPVVRTAALRYGWITWMSPADGLRVDPNARVNVLTRIRDWFEDGLMHGNPYRAPSGPMYPGPHVHTMPSWQNILDPFRIAPTDWDLTPPRDTLNYFDASWWAPEFFTRRAGAIVPLDFQMGFFRRAVTPFVASAMSWDSVRYIPKPPALVHAALIAMKGPNEPRFGIRDTMTSRALRGLFGAVPEGPSVLSLEIVPRTGTGASGRARFSINAPAPLALLQPGELALSDPILVRATAGQSAPTSVATMLPRMYGSTTLAEPARIGVFWEAYGFANGDTVDVAVRIIRKNDANVATRALAAAGIGSARADSAIYRWREPRREDPSGTREGGVTIQPRGIVVDLSSLVEGTYTLEVLMRRGAVEARSRREFAITRK